MVQFIGFYSKKKYHQESMQNFGKHTRRLFIECIYAKGIPGSLELECGNLIDFENWMSQGEKEDITVVS